MHIKPAIFTAALIALLSAPAFAEDPATFTISIKDGAFVPAVTRVPAGQKIHLIVKNEDGAKAEFESTRLDREQKIAPGDQTDVYVGPLDPGTYEFFDDNNPEAKGSLLSK